ncbi:MAG TPA: ABC transporter ATP-binding protein [Desulfotomaculum sp.]|nr:ABC transporter ATP-binding protein [Desulfotomaculum sp.]
MIKVRGLKKNYGRVQALKGLDMDVPAGSIYGFIGQNGAGKTTALRILAGLLVPDQGLAEVAGWDIMLYPRAVREAIGYMPDFFGVYDDLRVGEYLLFYASAYGIKGPRADKLRDDLLELVELGDKREAFVDTLSRGMQQRLCLARALVHDPPVLLLDEPASGLDPLARVEMREILKELGRMGKTILVSSHILTELADLCTHIGMITEGSLVRQGVLADLLNNTPVRKIVLRCACPPEKAVKVLEDWPGVEAINCQPHQVEFGLVGGLIQVAELLKELVNQEVPVTHFAQEEQTLEDTFVQLASQAGV